MDSAAPVLHGLTQTDRQTDRQTDQDHRWTAHRLAGPGGGQKAQARTVDGQTRVGLSCEVIAVLIKASMSLHRLSCSTSLH
jgi:hypothetical protein